MENIFKIAKSDKPNKKCKAILPNGKIVCFGDYLNIPSRSELKTNPEARKLLDTIHKEYNAWKTKT